MTLRKAQSEKQIARFMSWLGAAAALIFAVSIPLVYYVFSTNALFSSLAVETSHIASSVEQIVHSRPDMWEYETVRLLEILSQPPFRGEPDERIILNNRGKIIAQTNIKVKEPAANLSIPVFDTGRIVASIETRRSLRKTIFMTAFLGILSSLLGYLLYFIFRTYPLKMLETTLADLRRERDVGHTTLQAIGEGVISVDAGGKIRLMNRMAAIILGCSEPEAVGRPLEDFYVLRELKEDRHREGIIVGLYTDRKGRERIIRETRFNSEATEPGGSGAVIVFRDVTERRRVRDALEESEAKYHDLYENAPDMYYSVDLETGAVTECNETLLRITGYGREEIIGRPIIELYHPDNWEEVSGALQQFPVTGEVHNAERRVQCKNGRIIDVSLNVSAVRNREGKIIYSRSTWHDITERKKYEELIKTLSITDQLSGLYNRRGFMTLAEQQMRVAERTKESLLLLFADLDDLKKINDNSGHKSGDAAIIETAAVLREVFRKMDVLARMGGDEFAVLVTEASSESFAMIENRLKSRLAAHNARTNREYNLSLSIGVAFYDPSQPCTLDELISLADSAMYRQKLAKKP